MHSFFFLQIYQVSYMSTFYKDHVGIFDTWLSLEEEKFKTIYLNEHKSVSPKRNAKRHLKLTKNLWSWKLFPLYYVYLKFWSLSPFLTNKVLFVNRWPHSVDTPKGGVEHMVHKVEFPCYYSVITGTKATQTKFWNKFGN